MEESVVFLNQTLQGAQDLLRTTHNYIKWQAPRDIKQMDPRKCYKVSCEAMRITVRMTQVMAWLSLQKAFQGGDLSQEELISEKYQVLGGKTILESDSEEDNDLPLRLRELLKESRSLYVRILRLDEIIRKPPHPPSLSCESKLEVVLKRTK